jgi:phosphatidylglycerophosphatase A
VFIGFVLFRLFDIFKPYPLRHLEKVKWGIGVIADDVGAGMYALVVLTVIRHFLGA